MRLGRRGEANMGDRDRCGECRDQFVGTTYRKESHSTHQNQKLLEGGRREASCRVYGRGCWLGLFLLDARGFAVYLQCN